MTDAKPLRVIDESRIFSQNGEDGIINKLIKEVKIFKGFFVEIGSQNGRECNCRNLLENHDWRGIMIDDFSDYDSNILNYNSGAFLNICCLHITKDNAVNFIKSKVSLKDVNLLSLDIDGYDYWILKELMGEPDFRPEILVLEYNSQLGPNKSLTIKYDENHRWDGTYYQGCSLMAWVNLLVDYRLVYCESKGVNCFFVRKDKINFVSEPKDLFKGPVYNEGGWPEYIKDGQEWVSV